MTSYEFDIDGGANEIATIKLEDGSSYTLEGETDGGNIPTSVDRINYFSDIDGIAVSGSLELAEDSTPREILFEDGSRITLDWSLPGEVSFVYLSADGTQQVISTIDIKSEKAKSIAQSTSYSLARRSEKNVDLLSSKGSQIAPMYEGATYRAVNGKTGDKTVNVSVQRCGLPVTDAKVQIDYHPNTFEITPDSRVFAKHQGNGVYEAAFGRKSLEKTDVGGLCRDIASVLGTGCAITTGARGLEPYVCTSIALAVTSATSGGAAGAFALIPECTSALIGYNTYCLVHDSGAIGTASVADFVCDSIAKLEDKLLLPGETSYRWKAKAYVQGDTLSAPQQNAAYNDDVSFSLDFGGAASITGFSTIPFDPRPLDVDYIATASSSCTTGWTSNVSVIGTDGYFDTVSTVNTEDSTFMSLNVPGDRERDSDTLRFEVSPPDGVSIPSLLRETSIAFLTDEPEEVEEEEEEEAAANWTISGRGSISDGTVELIVHPSGYFKFQGSNTGVLFNPRSSLTEYNDLIGKTFRNDTNSYGVEVYIGESRFPGTSLHRTIDGIPICPDSYNPMGSMTYSLSENGANIIGIFSFPFNDNDSRITNGYTMNSDRGCFEGGGPSDGGLRRKVAGRFSYPIPVQGSDVDVTAN